MKPSEFLSMLAGGGVGFSHHFYEEVAKEAELLEELEQVLRRFSIKADVAGFFDWLAWRKEILAKLDALRGEEKDNG